MLQFFSKKQVDKITGFTPLEIYTILKRRVRNIPQLSFMRSGSPRSVSLMGFTLIELLVVIAIIGILSTIVLASLNKARSRALDARRITNIKQLQLALELYYDSSAGNGQYPLASTDCSAATQYGLQVLAPNYIPQVPRDPLSTGADNGCYAYATPGGAALRSSYHLGASLQNTDAPELTSDRDFNSSGFTSAVNAFNGLSAAAPPNPCNTTAGPSGTETCFDATP